MGVLRLPAGHQSGAVTQVMEIWDKSVLEKPGPSNGFWKGKR